MLRHKLVGTILSLLPILGLTGCADTQIRNNTSSTSSTASASTISNTIAPAKLTKANVEMSSAKLIPVVVSKETDGDTIHVTLPNGQDKTIRMLLIDTPEDVKPHTPVEPFSLQAAAFAKEELPIGRPIFIEEGKPGYTSDKYGRLLAFVYVTKTDMYNEDVVKKGLARVGYIYPPNTQHLSALEADQSYAKQHHLGIWTIPGYATPNGYNLSAVKSPNTSSEMSGTKHTSSKLTPLPKATATPSTNVSLRLISFTQNVSPGDNASITIHGKPGTTATIEVDYKSGPSHAQGLVPETVGANGDVTWQWKVGTRTTPGNWPVMISDNGQNLQATLHVA